MTIEKPFSDQSKRNVIFKRVNRETKRFWLNWVPVASSLVEGGTVAPNNLIDISKMEFFLPDGSTISVTDPQKYYMRYKWLRLYDGGQTDMPEYSNGQPVKTGSNIDEYSFRHGSCRSPLWLRCSKIARRAKLSLKSQVNNGERHLYAGL